MQCPQCGAALSPGDLFCGDCGAAVSAAAAGGPAAAATPPVGLVSTPPLPPSEGLGSRPVQSGSYAAEISRMNPACLIFLVDCSGSMDGSIAGGEGQKKLVVADAINRLLYNTVLRCAKEDGVRPYFDVGMWTYGGSAEVTRSLPADLVSIREIAERPKRTEVRRKRVPDGAGGVYEEEFQLPLWFDPVASGNTPMNAAFRAILSPLRAWVAQHPRSFPPIVIHLTDGVYTDASPAPVVYELMQLATSDGNVLVFNCHISEQGGLTIPFPGDAEAPKLSGFARELYDISSQLPPSMARAAQAKSYQVSPGARGYAYHADQVTLIDFLDIGTRAMQDRMETA